MAFGPATARGPYHESGAIQAGWAMATAAKHQGATPSAESSTLLRHVRLLDGAVRVRKLWTSASLAANADGTVHDLTGGDIHGLVVLGRHVHPAAGKTLPLDDWGTLAVLTTQPTTLNGAVTADTITGLRLTLLHDHAGLAAGTVVALGTAKAAVTIPPAPAGGGSGGGSGGGGGAPSPPPPPKVHHPAHHHHRHHPQPARHHRRHHVAQARPVHLTQASHALIDAAAGGRARVIAAALAQVGWPYIWGGDSRSEGGFDCSGLVDYAFAHAGMALPGRPTAAVLYRMSMPVGPKHLAPGDLAFLYSRHRAPYHVALYVGDGLMVVAPHTGAKVQIEPLSSVPWDGYGRLLQGGRGDGLARSVAAAARRFAHPGSGRLAAARAGRRAGRPPRAVGRRALHRAPDGGPRAGADDDEARGDPAARLARERPRPGREPRRQRRGSGAARAAGRRVHHPGTGAQPPRPGLTPIPRGLGWLRGELLR